MSSSHLPANDFRPPFFDEAGRTVTKAVVAAVMRSFFLNYFGLACEKLATVAEAAPAQTETVEPCYEDAMLAAIDEDLRLKG